MRLPKLEIVTGEALRVAYSADARGGPHADPVNRVTVAVRGPEGERDLTFEDCTVGVATGHRLSAAYALGKDRTARLVLVQNHTTGQRQTSDAALRRAAAQKSVAARWRALLGGVLAGLAFYGVALVLRPGEPWIVPALAIGALGVAVLWIAFAILDAALLPQREREIAERLRHELEGRLHAAFPPPPAPSGPTLPV